MREAVQHDWTRELKSECGWADGGKKLLALAQLNPTVAEERWGHLLETDGGRGRFNATTGAWEQFQC